MADMDTLKWVRRASALLLLIIGWVFVLANNHFRATASSIMIGLGYTAAVAAVYTLFRTGATAVATTAEDLGAAEWGAPMGPRGELEREKRMLLKAIREAEFDHEMGKLSKTDADLMIAQYRARAIAIIKQLDTVEGESASTRQSIEREIRARIELGGAKGKGKKAKGKASGVRVNEEADSTASPEAAAAATPVPETEPSDEPEVAAASEPPVEPVEPIGEPVAAVEPVEANVVAPVAEISKANGAPKQAASNTKSGKNKSGKGGKKAAKKESA